MFYQANHGWRTTQHPNDKCLLADILREIMAQLSSVIKRLITPYLSSASIRRNRDRLSTISAQVIPITFSAAYY
jgi:hypothetical protein